MPNHRKTLVATVMMYDRMPEEAKMMMKSAAYHGIELTVIGEGIKYQDFYQAKIRTLWETLKDCRGYDHVIFADGGDTLFATGLGELFTKWETYQSDFVIAGEAGCWPFTKRYRDLTPGTDRFRYPNSGFYMATWEAWLRTMPPLLNMPHDDYMENGKTIQNDDQAVLFAAWMEKRISFTVDSQCLLCQCMTEIDSRTSFLAKEIDWGRRPVNKITGSAPCVFHCNAVGEKWRMAEIWEMLRL